LIDLLILNFGILFFIIFLIIGLNINLGDKATFSPYVEYLMDGQDNSFERKEIMVGTRLAFKLN